MERYPIPTTVDNFVRWLDEYGGWQQQGRYTIKSYLWNNEINHDVLAPDRRSSGQFYLRIERDESTMERFWVTVQPYGSEVVLSPYLVEYRDSLIAAIREKWSGKTQMQDKSSIPEGIRLLPTEPSSNWERADIFDWYHRGGKLFIPEIRQLAPYLGLVEGSVNNAHSAHKDVYHSGRKPNNESNFAGMFIPPIDEE